MKLPTDVKGVFAIVVGVEHYRGDWPLSGPALDALTMARWLCEQGVPVHQIHVFHNVEPTATEGHKRACADLVTDLIARGVHMLGEPHRSQLEEILCVSGLEALGAPSGSVLWLFWSGHGVMTDIQEQRFVVASNAASQELHAINVDQVCAQLRTSPKLMRFAQQLVIVDACSTWSRSWKPISVDWKLDGASTQKVAQDRIFASLNGKRAGIAKGQALSVFTDHLITLLKKTSLAGLDLNGLWDQLKEATDKSNQPCLIERIDPDGRKGRANGGRPIDVCDRTEELANIVDRPGIQLSQLQSLFRATTGCESSEPVATSARALVWDLDQMTRRAGIASRNSEWFAIQLHFQLRRLLEDNLPPKLREELTAVESDLAKWLAECDQTALTEDRNKLIAAAAACPVLFVDLGHESMRVWIHQGEWRFVTSMEPSSAVNVGLAAAWQVAVDVGFVYRNCHMELAVSFEDLCRLPLGASLSPTRLRRIGMEVPFSVRLRDRWVDRELLNNWLEAYKQSQIVMDCDVDLDWLDLRMGGDCDSPGSPNSWLCVNDLGAPRWVECLRGHLDQGVAWALACSAIPTDMERQDITVRARKHTLREWMRVARAMAEMARASDQGARIVVLADRPDRLPPGAADRLAIPMPNQ